MARVCPCHRNRHRPCDKVKLLALLCAAASGFTLLELFYSEITPIRKIVTPSELYVSNKQRQRQALRSHEGITTTPAPKVTPTAPHSTPVEITFVHDNSHGVEGIFVENEYRFPEHKMQSVAIGCAITCRKLEDLTTSNIGQKAPVIRTLLSSFCKTASIGFEYHFYLTYDHDDPYFMTEGALDAFRRTFLEVAEILCVPETMMKLHLIKVMYHSKPAWAQNDAMMEAYLDGMEYMYRLNDDVQLMTRNWTLPFISTLQKSDPPNIGIVGPQHFGGNEAIITLDFVHRTHVDIFGFYYPRKFTDWFADDWITGVYQPLAYKMHTFKAVHTYEKGTRYNHTVITEPDLVQKTINRDRTVLNRFLQMKRKQSSQTSSKTMVISMCLYGDDPRYTLGTIRNAQLAPVVFPGWTLRVYVEKVNSDGQTKYPRVPQRILTNLRQLGAQIVQVDSSAIDSPPMMWRFLVLDDNTVEYFIVRDVDSRLSERDADAVRDWMQTGKPFHCIRDHPSHASSPVFGGLWGGRLPHLRELIRIPMTTLMKGYKEGYMEDIAFMSNAIWPKVNQFAYCHDSVSCQKWVNAYQFPFQRHGLDYVGGVYDQFGQLRQVDIDIMVKTTLPRECSRFPDEYTKWEHVNGVKGILELQNRANILDNATNTKSSKTTKSGIEPFEVPKLVNLYTNVVVWSADLAINPIRGIKSLLAPLGVQFIDKSLAPDCESVHTCARDLKVLNKGTALHPSSEIIQRFTDIYQSDPEMRKVTHILCGAPASVCELYTNLKKSLIVLVNERYESGREDGLRWEGWNRHLSDISLDPSNVIAANNHYDVEYLRYFTGLSPEYLPPFCGYFSSTYKPTRPEVLLEPIMDDNTPFMKMFLDTFNNANKRFKYNTRIGHLNAIYPYRHSLSDAASHPAVVYVPNQVSMFSACEHYSMSIPMFFPSLDLLTKWHLEYQIISNLTLNKIRQKFAADRQDTQEQVNQLGFGSPIHGVAAGRWDPNNDHDMDSLRYWLRFADFYQWPHITHFESIEHLVFQLNTLDLGLISRKMSDYSKTFHEELIKKWVQVIDATLLNKH